MRFSLVAFVLSAAVASVSAQANCAQSCFAAGPIGNCNYLNNTCLCLDNAYITNVTACIEATCQGSNITQSIQFGNQLCLSVGVTLAPGVPMSTPAGGAPSSSASAPMSTSGALSNTANIVFGAAAAGLLALAL